MNLQERLIEALNYSGKKKIDIAKKLSISRSAVTDWFTGKTKEIKAGNLLELSNFLGVSAEWLESGKGKMVRTANQAAKTLSDEAIDIAIQYMALSSESKKKTDEYISLLMLSEK